MSRRDRRRARRRQPEVPERFGAVLRPPVPEMTDEEIREAIRDALAGIDARLGRIERVQQHLDAVFDAIETRIDLGERTAEAWAGARPATIQ